jgi:hypothetical protein
MENHFSKELLSADDLMKVSWRMFKERFLKFLYIFLLSIVFFLFVFTILFALALFQGSSAAIFSALLLILLSLLIIAIIQNLMFFEVIRNKHVRIRQAFRRAVSRFKPYVGSLFFYLLAVSNLLVLIAFLGFFILMSAMFVSLISYMQSVSVVFGMVAAFLIFFVGVLLTVCTVYAYTWQYFFFFDVIMQGMPVRESLDHSFSLISRNKRDIFEKSGMFLLLSILVLLTLSVISTFASGLGFIVEAGNYVMSAWAVVYLYAMFEDIKETAPEKVNAADRQSVSLLLKSGSVIVLTTVLLVCFSLALFFAQLGYSSHQAASRVQSSGTITAAESL